MFESSVPIGRTGWEGLGTLPGGAVSLWKGFEVSKAQGNLSLSLYLLPEDQDAMVSHAAPAPGLSVHCHDQASKADSKPPVFFGPWCLFTAINST